ncbi:DMT family transporter [Coralliovum pocilloporae]|uniref:DMT family transporter n=1 Tax=Coralliovum pocilloporae TaxID=3066369 RepID=UPI00330796F6
MSAPDQTASSNPMVGIGLMAAAMAVIPLMDVFAKLLSSDHGAIQIGLGRFIGQAVMALVVMALLRQKTAWLPTRLSLHFWRGALLAIATLFFFAALKTMPIANALAIFFVEPMILTALSAVLLKEQVGPRRVIAVVVGFGGALLVIKPSWSVFGPAALLPLVTATAFAGYLLLTRILSGTGNVWSQHLATGLSGSLILGLALIVATVFGFEEVAAKAISSTQWAYYIGLALVGAGAHSLIVLAFARAPAATLAPLTYLEIVSATVLGYLVFADFPDALTWLGIVIIVGSGLYIMHRERIRQSPIAGRRRPVKR